MPAFTLSRVLVLVALIVFVLAAFRIGAPLDLVATGLAVFMASHLVP